ncbi:MAG: hypothetical protein ACR2QF_06320 [Geminicoccaceae bacterium]
MMFNLLIFLPLSLVISTAFIGSSAAGQKQVTTDANLVTTLDVSGSIDPSTEAFEFDDMAATVVHPAFLQGLSVVIIAGAALAPSPDQAKANLRQSFLGS